MALTQTENIWLGHDNRIDLILKVNNTAVSTSSATDMKLVLGKTIIASSNSSSDFIRWGGLGYATGEVRISLGRSTLIKPGKYDAKLVVYGATYSSGVVWDDNIPIRVIPDVMST